MVEPSSLRLPAGMRDFAPGAATARRHIAETLIGLFERWGFAQVITPAFEYEVVLARGLGSDARAAALRFVEPSSGQVLALRPDITPQIARLMATRFAHEDGPLRLCYEGSVFRYDSRARAQKEVLQAGVELAGVPGTDGDVEAITLAIEGLRAVGITDVTIDLALPALAREVLEAVEVSETERAALHARVAKQDRAGVRRLLENAPTKGKGQKAIVELAARLPALSGSPEILLDAERGPARQVPLPGVREALAHLRELVQRLQAARLPARLHLDLGEVRGFDYYTGVRFQAFVDGVPDAVAAGGRYDALLGRYGRSRPAVGFAVDVELAVCAVEARPGAAQSALLRPGNEGGSLVVGPARAATAVAAELRAAGERASTYTGKGNGVLAEARRYATRWGFSQVVDASGMDEI